MKLSRSLASIAFVLTLSSLAAAHEYWLEPAKFRLSADQKVAVKLFVGDGLIKDQEEKAFQAEKTPKFMWATAGSSSDLLPSMKEGSLPFFTFSAKEPGLHYLAMERNWSYLTLEAAAFEDYLRTDGMDYIIGERKKLGESAKEGKERYSRFLKSLLQVGGKNGKLFSKDLGMKLEIIPLQNPYAKKIGDTMKFRVLFNGKPLAGRALFADNRGRDTQRQTTDRNGEASFKIDRNGLWLVRVVTMQRCSEKCEGADWESFWTALTFGM